MFGLWEYVQIRVSSVNKLYVLYKMLFLVTTYLHFINHCTEVRFASLFPSGFNTVIVVNPPERKLAKRTSVQWSDPHSPKNDAKISPLCICQNDNLEMIQLVSTEHEKMDDENPRNNLLTRIKSMRHGSNGSVRASGRKSSRTGTTNSSIVSGQAHRCRPCLFI